MNVIAYTYEADVHCPGCTKDRAPTLRLDHNHPYAMGTSMQDENCIEYDLVDVLGNLISPIFSTDQHEFTNCSDCGGVIE